METVVGKTRAREWSSAARAALELRSGAQLGPLLEYALMVSESAASLDRETEQFFAEDWRALRGHPGLETWSGLQGLLDALLGPILPSMEEELRDTAHESHEEAHPLLRELLRHAVSTPGQGTPVHQLRLGLRIFRAVFPVAEHHAFSGAQQEAYAQAQVLRGSGPVHLAEAALDETGEEVLPFLAWVADPTAEEEWRSLAPLLRFWCAKHPWFAELLRSSGAQGLFWGGPEGPRQAAQIESCNSLDFEAFVVGPGAEARRWLLGQGARHPAELVVLPRNEHTPIEPDRCRQLSAVIGSAAGGQPELGSSGVAPANKSGAEEVAAEPPSDPAADNEASQGLRFEKPACGLMRLTGLEWPLEQIQTKARKTHNPFQARAKAFERWLQSPQVLGGVVILPRAALAEPFTRESLLRHLADLVDQVADTQTNAGKAPYRWAVVLTGPVGGDTPSEGGERPGSQLRHDSQLARDYRDCVRRSLVVARGRDIASLQSSAASHADACRSPAFALRLQEDLETLQDWLAHLTKRGFRSLAIAYSGPTSASRTRGQGSGAKPATAELWSYLHESIAATSRRARGTFAQEFANWELPTGLREEAAALGASRKSLHEARLVPVQEDWAPLLEKVGKSRLCINTFDSFFEARRKAVVPSAPAHDALGPVLHQLLAGLGISPDLEVDRTTRRLEWSEGEQGAEEVLTLAQGIAQESSGDAEDFFRLQWPEAAAPSLTLDSPDGTARGWRLPVRFKQQILLGGGRASLTVREYLVNAGIDRVDKVLLLLALCCAGNQSDSSWHRSTKRRAHHQDTLHHAVLMEDDLWARIWQTDAIAIHAVCLAAESLGSLPPPLRASNPQAGEWRFRRTQLLSLLSMRGFTFEPDAQTLRALADKWLAYGHPRLGSLPLLRGRRTPRIEELNALYVKTRRASGSEDSPEGDQEDRSPVHEHLSPQDATRLRKEAYLALCCNLAAIQIGKKYPVAEEPVASAGPLDGDALARKLEVLGRLLQDLHRKQIECVQRYHVATWLGAQWLADTTTLYPIDLERLPRTRLSRAVEDSLASDG